MEAADLALHRHLDDNHQELPEVQQDEVKNWFDKQVLKAKKFQPLAVINQKLKGLDVFEPNDAPLVPPSQPSHARSTSSISRTHTPEVHPRDPDEVVSRTHWQKAGYNDSCTEPACGKKLGAVNGNVNCRKCGRLFCEEHTMYQMKLSRSAQHEPVRGYWCRCCETCYKSREGYNDHHGYQRDHISMFQSVRRKKVDKAYLEISRLEKRLTKLTQLLANPPEDLTGGGSILSLSRQKDQRKILEQSVVTWEEDASVSRCPFCQQVFGSWSFRRHHCRLCGRVVCADPNTGCSSEIGLNVEARKYTIWSKISVLIDSGPTALTEKANGALSMNVRMCRDCKSTVFAKKDFAAALAQKPPDQKAYENLVQFEKGIRSLMPNFQRLLTVLQDPDKTPTAAQIADATKIRKRLMDSFTKYQLANKRLRDLPASNQTQLRLQKAIYQQGASFLNIHMLPLQALPKILKHASPNGLPPAGRSALSAIKYNDIETSSQRSSNSAVSALESEEKELKERLIVLEEQRFFVGEMIADANKRRKFDEVKSLTGNLDDLKVEIDSVNGMLEALDFKGAWERDQSGSR